MKLVRIYVLLGLISPIQAFAQTHPKKLELKAISSVAEYFERGKFSAHSRSFFMKTINQGELKDYYALTTGAGIGYKSPSYRGFGFGLNGFFIFKIASNSLAQPDNKTGKQSRYELGLLDVSNPHNGEDLDRLEEAYIYYQKDYITLELGRMCLNSPFINGQDSRMRPSLEEGLTINFAKNHLKLSGAYLWAMSPRSTVLWYPLGQSIGLYGTGQNIHGEKANYANKTHSKGLALLGLSWSDSETSIEFWNTAIANINNTAFLKSEKQLHTKAGNFKFGLQLMRQDKLGNGGNTLEEYRYMEAEAAEALSGRIELVRKRSSYQLNYTRITNTGRFLFPREWGKEPFYTTMSRERNEGYGDVHAFSANYFHKLSKSLQCKVAAGYYDLPNPENPTLNKYDMNDYMHWSLELDYIAQGAWKGVECKLLLVLKDDVVGEENPMLLFNKSNMAQLNLVLDYYFRKQH